MKASTLIAALGLLAPLSMAAVPAHFSDRAREILADEVAVVPAEHPLNIVYFLGNDNQPVAGYERRLSELMLYVQQFYAKEMTRNGFPGRSFGLERLENGNVKLHLVRGKRPSREYAYATGHNFCMADIKEYAAANPGQLRSDHILVIMPTFYDEKTNDMSPGGVPFYGLGRNCFALDYAHFDIKHLGQDTHEGRLLTKWLGGLAHELGHGLHKDVLKQQTMNLGNLLLMAVAAWVAIIVTGMHTAFGFAAINYGFAYILLGCAWLALFTPLTGLLMSAYSRRAEYRADRQAVKEGYGPAMITGLKKLARENFAHLAPARALVILQYSHPPMSERIAAIEAEMSKKSE